MRSVWPRSGAVCFLVCIYVCFTTTHVARFVVCVLGSGNNSKPCKSGWTDRDDVLGQTQVAQEPRILACIRVHISAIWRIRMKDLRVAATRAFAESLWALVWKHVKQYVCIFSTCAASAIGINYRCANFVWCIDVRFCIQNKVTLFVMFLYFLRFSCIEKVLMLSNNSCTYWVYHSIIDCDTFVFNTAEQWQVRYCHLYLFVRPWH